VTPHRTRQHERERINGRINFGVLIESIDPAPETSDQIHGVMIDSRPTFPPFGVPHSGLSNHRSSN
jgi:hypothetical protein